MEMKLFDAELKIMEMIWEGEPVSAKELARIAAEKMGWNKNTTYTVIKRLIGKKAVARAEPGFLCTSLFKREDVQKAETKNLIDRLFGGSKKAFLAAFVAEELSDDEADEMYALIEKRK